MHIFGYDMPRLHAALNDLPAALLVVAVLFELAAWAWKRESLKWAALWTLWAGVIGGWAAVIAGELAEDAIATGVYGGKLMFEHAAGIPTKTMQAEMQDREKAHHHEEGEAEEHEHPSAGTDTTHHDASGTSSHTH